MKTSRMSWIAAALLLAISSVPIARAQGLAVEKHILKSTELGEDREIWIGLPASYGSGQERYQVLYVLDGDGLLPPAAAQAHYLTLMGKMPPVIVVGIRSKSVADRGRNFTPPTGEVPPNPDPASGGADRFLGFLTREVRPFIEGRYRTQPFAILAGHSLAGLFTVYAMAKSPASFDAYFALSPTLGWKDRWMLRHLEAFLSRTPPPGGILYVSMGNEGPRFPVEPFQQLGEQLKKRAGPSLQWRSMYFEREDHVTTVPPALWDAMRWLYGDWSISDPNAVTLAALDGHYAKLTEKFGYRIPLPEAAINRYGYAHLQAGRVKEALAAFVLFTERYPQSPDAWDGLGDAYEANGELDKARSAVDKAIELAEKDHPNREEFLKHRERIEALRKARKTT